MRTLRNNQRTDPLIRGSHKPFVRIVRNTARGGIGIFSATMQLFDRRTLVLHLAHSCGAFRSGNGEATKTTLRRFVACFGCSPEACDLIWECLDLQGKLPPRAAPKHLFWMLFFLKVYPTESVAAVHFQCDEKTFRFWVWTMADAVRSLNMVRTNATSNNCGTCFDCDLPVDHQNRILTLSLLGHRFGGKIGS
jgi:hypothetical protein